MKIGLCVSKERSKWSRDSKDAYSNICAYIISSKTRLTIQKKQKLQTKMERFIYDSLPYKSFKADMSNYWPLETFGSLSVCPATA